MRPRFSLYKFSISCVLFLTLTQYARAQTTTNTETGKDTSEIGNLLKQGLEQSNPDSAIDIYKRASQKSIKLKYYPYTATLLLLTGVNYGYKGDYPQGLIYMKQALPYCYSLIEQSNYYDHLAWAYLQMGDYVAAAENYYTALEYAKKNDLPDHHELFHEVGVYQGLAEVYIRLHQNEKALYYLNTAEQIARQHEYENYIAILLLTKGKFYTSRHSPDSIRHYYTEIIAIAEKLNRPEFKILANTEIGVSFIESADYEKAAFYLLKAIELTGDSFENDEINASFYLGEAWYHRGKYRQAEEILVKAIKNANRVHLKDNLINAYKTLTEVYKASGQYKKALECMDTIGVLKDTLVNAENAKAINLMDIKFQTAEKDKQIALQKNRIVEKNIWILSIGGGVFLLLIVSTGIYRNTLHKQRLQAEIIKSLKQENKIGVLRAAVQGEDNERRRIARELHDGIGGMLGAAIMRFSTMHYDHKEITQVPAYQEAMNILTEMGTEIRKTAHNLMPEVLLKQNLTEALRTFCNTLQSGGQLKIDFQSYGSFDNFPEELKLNIYRIVQELLKNILEHARAHHAFVQLMVGENILTITVEDDGTGFNKAEIRNGLGLHNLKTRVSSLDGHFTLESQPGKGTSVFIAFELQNLPGHDADPGHESHAASSG